MNSKTASNSETGRSKLKTYSWLFVWLAVAIQVATAVICALAILSGDPGWSMVTALILMPVAVITTIVLGITSVILSILYKVRFRDARERWWIPIVIAIVAMFLLPVVLTILVFVIQ